MILNPLSITFKNSSARNKPSPLIQAARKEIASPFHFFDGIYCINLDRRTDRWAAMQIRFQKLGIARRIRRFAAADTPTNSHIGCALSHRRVIAEAKRQALESILVLEDDARFSADAADVLHHSLRELQGRDWQLLYLGGYRSNDSLRQVPGSNYLEIPTLITCTHAIAYHHSVYDAILSAVPESPADVAVWVGQYLAIDQFYTQHLNVSRFITCPVIATQDSILAAETRPFDD